MHDLHVSDKVLSANNRSQTVYTFTHMHQTKPSIFLKIYAGEPSEMPLELSAVNMLFLEGKANTVPALLLVGDVVAGANGPRVDTKIWSDDREGFYAPHTTDQPTRPPKEPSIWSFLVSRHFRIRYSKTL
jgi:hypothetical protein